MKKVIPIIIFILLNTLIISAQCEDSILENSGKIIASKNFEFNDKTSQNEIILSLEAAVKNSSWEIKGAEGAVLTLFIDGKYNQDAILFSGAEKFSYQFILGKFSVGKHKITATLNNERSAKNIGEVKIYSLNIKPLISISAEDKLAIENTPILYARPDTVDKFSDIPLLTYYEILPIVENSYKIRYTTIFTNEDGGTQTTALMARWGRTTDIEWVTEIEVKDGKIQSEIYQGVNHITKNFAGKRILGIHPVMFDASVNNNFSDTGCSRLRTALVPIRADLSKKSREVVMDENAWTYRIMAQELTREGRINPLQMGVNTIDDLRNYLYVEISSENNSAAVAVEIKTTDGKLSRSDFDNPRLRVDRSGYKRIAVRLPSTNSSIQSLSLICQSIPDNKTVGVCQNSQIIKFVWLDKDYRLIEKLNPRINFASLKSGENLIWLIEGK